MKINKEIIKRLDSKRDQQIEEAARQLLEKGDLKSAKEKLEWVETSSKLLSSIKRPHIRLIWSTIIAFICLLIGGLAWTLHIPTTKISLELITENASMILGKEWSSNHQFITDELYINNIVYLSIPGVNFHKSVNHEDEPFAINLKGKEIIVNELILRNDAEIELNLNGNQLKLFVKSSPVTGKIFVQHADLKIEFWEESIIKQINSEIPETISFRSAKTVADPVLFELENKENWRLRDLNIRDIGFLEEYPPGSGKFESLIQSGKVALPEIGFTRDLRTADRLILNGMKNSRLEISKDDNKIKIFFEGSVNKILVGPNGVEKNLAPTYLEYLYHQKKLAFFWGIVVFLWGMLFFVIDLLSIRNMIFK